MLDSQKKVLETQLNEAQNDATSRDELKQRLNNAIYEKNELTRKNGALEQSNNDLRSRNRKLSEELSEIKGADVDKDSEIKALTDRCSVAEGDKERLSADLKASQVKLNEANNYITSLQSQLEKAHADVAQAKKSAREEMKRQDAENEARREEQGRSFDRLMREREEVNMRTRADAQKQAKEQNNQQG